MVIGKRPASTTDITVSGRHGGSSDITLTEDVAVEWNFTLAQRVRRSNDDSSRATRQLRRPAPSLLRYVGVSWKGARPR
jgi:hypothetical protein